MSGERKGSGTGRVLEVREFCLHDGPGVRTTVFLQGCPLRCAWCHNPEGQDPAGGTLRTAEDVVDEVMRHADFLGASGGGVTFSGGEPLLQPDFVHEMIGLLRERGSFNIALETSGHAEETVYRQVAEAVDFIFQDLKLPDAALYRKWTGASGDCVFRNLAWLKASGRRFVARIPLIPGVNDSVAAKKGFVHLLGGAIGLDHVELLPYNALAGAKYMKLGRPYRPGFDEGAPPNRDSAMFAEAGIACKVF